MWVCFKKAKVGYSYFKGDKANLPEEEAEKLIDDGFACATDPDETDSDLPADLPGRTQLIKGGIATIEQVLNTRESLTDIPGIGNATARQIIEILTKGE